MNILTSYAYIEFNSLLNDKDIGLFCLDNTILIRKFTTKKGKIILKADNKNFEDIDVTNCDNFYIIGKILNNK